MPVAFFRRARDSAFKFPVHWRHQTRNSRAGTIAPLISVFYELTRERFAEKKRKKRAFLLTARVFCPIFPRARPPRGGQVFANLALRTYLPLGLKTGLRRFETVPSALWLVWWQVKTQVLLVRL